MASDIGVGDSETAALTVAPADTDTAVTLTVRAPDGTSAAVAVSGGTLSPIDGSDDSQQQWTSDEPVTYSAAGRWVLHWDVFGTGEGAEDYEVYVVASPVASGPTWIPGRSRVANYVPHRTLARSVSTSTSSADTYQFTFDSTTVPTGLQCDRLIADGVDWITGLIPNLPASLEPTAALIAALWAAVAVERSWPNDDQSLQRANDMEKTLDGKLTKLIEAATLINGTGDYGIEIAHPAFSFPRSDCRWDSPGYW